LRIASVDGKFISKHEDNDLGIFGTTRSGRNTASGSIQLLCIFSHALAATQQQESAADISSRPGPPAAARDDSITERNHIDERLFPR
jgi:hypothetical protein